MSKDATSIFLLHSTLLHLIQADPIQDFPVDQAVNWEVLLQLATTHSVRPQLTKVLGNIPQGLVPEHYKVQLQQQSKDIALRQIANVREFFRIQQLLQAEGILAVPYKGFWLAHSAYGDFTKRESSDVDLYIEPEHIHKVQSIMFGLGYIPEVGAPIADPLLIMQYNGECNFDKFEGNTRIFHIEFHSAASSDKLGLAIGLKELQDQVGIQSFCGQKIQVFSPSALLLLTVIHHGGKDAWSSLKQVLDVGLLLQKEQAQLDWDWLQQQARNFDVEGLLWVGLGLAQELTHAPLPPALLPVIQQRKIQTLIRQRKQALYTNPAPNNNPYRAYAARLWFLWRCQQQWSSRARLLRKHLEPSPWNTPENFRNKALVLQLLARVKTLLQNVFSKSRSNNQPL